MTPEDKKVQSSDTTQGQSQQEGTYTISPDFLKNNPIPKNQERIMEVDPDLNLRVDPIEVFKKTTKKP